MADQVFPAYQGNRTFSNSLSPGAGTDNQFANLAVSLLAGRGIFPQPQGDNSVYDAMLQRSRNLNFHYIAKRATASSQMAAMMGGINTDSPIYQALYPLAAMPDSPVWKMMSPLIGGNAVKAQMGLYGDLNGQTMAMTGRMGGVSAYETDRMMDQLQGKFYKHSDFGRYVNSVEAPLRKTLGDSGFEKLNKDWSASTIRSLEGAGYTPVNRDVGNLLESTLSKMDRVRKNDNLSESDRSDKLADIEREANAAAESFFAKVSDPAAQKKISEAFTDALKSPDSKEAIKTFGKEWSAERQDAFRMMNRGLDVKDGKVPGSIDYRFTRGFNIEDITGAFGMSTNLGLTGKGGNLGDFGKSGIGALDAARSIFGRDLSGKELSQSLSKLIGTGYVNMADEGDGRKLEELLRNVKAMARVANVSIESMTGMIEAAKGIAQQHPSLGNAASNGLLATQVATKAVGDTTVSLAHMSGAQIRRMGGPIGITKTALQREMQSASEDVTTQLSALYAYAVETHPEGKNSKLAKRILQYSKTGDATLAGMNAFMRDEVPNLSGMQAYKAMAFSQNNPQLTALGLNMAPELRQAGENAFVQGNIFQVGDASLDGIVGETERAFMYANDPKYKAMSPEEIEADLKKAFPKADTEKLKKRLTPVLDLARRSKEPLSVTQVGAALQFTDYGHKWDMAEQLGYSQVMTLRYNPAAKNDLEEFQRTHKQSAELDAYYARQSASVNAGLGQRFVQSLLDGTLGSGGAAAFAELVGGGEDAMSYAQLQEVDRKMGLLPTAEEQDSPANRAKVHEILGQIYTPKGGKTALNFDNLSRIGNRTGVAALREVDSSGLEVENLARELRKSTNGTYQGIESILGMNSQLPGAADAAQRIHGKSGNMPRHEVEAIISGITNSTLKEKAFPAAERVGKQFNLSSSDVLSAAQDLTKFDNTGSYTSGFSPSEMLAFATRKAKYESYEHSTSIEARKLGAKIEELNGDPATAYEKLKRQFDGNNSVDFSLIERFRSDINVDTLLDIAKAPTPEKAGVLAKSALSALAARDPSKKGKGYDPESLIKAAKSVLTLDKGGHLGGSTRVSQEDLVRAYKATLGEELSDKALSPMSHLIGEGIWSRSKKATGAPATVAGTLSKISQDFLGGKEDVSELAEKMKDEATAKKIEAAASPEGMAELRKMIDQFEQQRAQLNPSSAAKADVMDFPGVIKAIAGLEAAIKAASQL